MGTNLNYTVNAPVPAGALSTFKITDPLHASLKLDQNSVKVVATGAEPPALTKDTDYTLTMSDNNLVVEFTDAGRKKLETARNGNSTSDPVVASDPTLQVSVSFAATIISVPASNDPITNTATVDLPNGASVTTDSDANGDGTPDTPVSTQLANLTITKTGPAGTPNADLNGAKFEVYQCQDPEGDGTWQLLGSKLSLSTTETVGTNVDVLTTAGGADAIESTAKAYGLPVSSTSTGATGTLTNDYCLLEVAAPAGFVANPDPIHVTYDSTAKTLAASVENKKDSIIGQLPATGAFGIVILFLLGLALLARGLYTSYKDNQAAA